jgi:hypothetical protein
MAEMKKIGWEVVKSLVAHNRKSKPRSSDVKVSNEKRGAAPLLNFHGVVKEDESDSS